MSTHPSPVVELIEQAMMSGFMQITANKSMIQASYSGATDQSGADLLMVALDGYPERFAAIRSDLIDAILAAERERIAQAIEAEASRSSYRDADGVTEAYLDAADIARTPPS